MRIDAHCLELAGIWLLCLIAIECRNSGELFPGVLCALVALGFACGVLYRWEICARCIETALWAWRLVHGIGCARLHRQSMCGLGD